MFAALLVDSLCGWLGPLAVVSAGALDPVATQDVRVVVVGTEEQRADMGQVVRELFAGDDVAISLQSLDRLDLGEIFEPAPEGESFEARAWISMEPSRALVFVSDGASERVLVRRLEFEALDAVALEEIGYVVDSSVRAILDGGTVGIEREAAKALVVPEEPPEPSGHESEPEQPAAAPEVTPGPAAGDETGPQRPPERLRWGVGAGYGVRWFGPIAAWHGPNLQAGVARPLGRWVVGGAVRGRIYLPARVTSGNLALDIWGGHAGARFDVTLMALPWLGVGFEPGVGVDLLRVRPVALDDTAEAFAPSLSVLPVVSASLGPEFYSPGRNRIRVGVRAAVDIDLAPTRYVSADLGQTVFQPWRVRPGVVFTIGWERR